MDIYIRRLEIKDVDAYFALRLQGLQEDATSFASTYSEEKETGLSFFSKVLRRRDNDNVMFGAFIQHQLVGVIGIFREDKIKVHHKGNIWGMYVDGPYRRKGIARKLLDTAIAHAKDPMQCLILYLTVEAANAGARHLYESVGFTAWGTEPYALRMGDKLYDEVHMALVLVPKAP